MTPEEAGKKYQEQLSVKVEKAKKIITDELVQKLTTKNPNYAIYRYTPVEHVAVSMCEIEMLDTMSKVAQEFSDEGWKCRVSNPKEYGHSGVPLGQIPRIEVWKQSYKGKETTKPSLCKRICEYFAGNDLDD